MHQILSRQNIYAVFIQMGFNAGLHGAVGQLAWVVCRNSKNMLMYHTEWSEMGQ